MICINPAFLCTSTPFRGIKQNWIKLCGICVNKKEEYVRGWCTDSTRCDELVGRQEVSSRQSVQTQPSPNQTKPNQTKPNQTKTNEQTNERTIDRMTNERTNNDEVRLCCCHYCSLACVLASSFLHSLVACLSGHLIALAGMHSCVLPRRKAVDPKSTDTRQRTM